MKASLWRAFRTGKVIVIQSAGGLGNSLYQLMIATSFSNFHKKNKKQQCPSGPIPSRIRSTKSLGLVTIKVFLGGVSHHLILLVLESTFLIESCSRHQDNA
ncbi:hypothetical protein PCANC_13383 [Puccinia coronata f. sp. avenae]|uniref:Uncharacterized protein n=1 Tax=Puccinia coronata f. sp. avenae TaxID=200324 RepID=A0A2N5VTP9_9BASI|nr:hypothetical protein PCANC_13383 [Puccinia coronata f. sp. avenae]